MKKSIVFVFCMIFIGASISVCFALDKKIEPTHEFIKIKPKKELSSSVKQDIGCELELLSRQISKNIIELAQIQEQSFDKIKDLMGASDDSLTGKSVFNGSTAELKEQRHKLKHFHQKLLQHQQDLQCFLSCF